MQTAGVLPKWIVKRYAILNKVISNRQFDFEEAYTVISKSFKKDDERIVRLLLSQLRKAGWITVEFDKDDNRMRVYKLNELNKIFQQIAEDIMIKSKVDKNANRKRTP